MITGAGPGCSKFTLMHDYDDYLKLHHRILSPSLGATATSQYQPLIKFEGTQMLFDLITALEEFTTGSTIDTKTIYPLLEGTQYTPDSSES